MSLLWKKGPYYRSTVQGSVIGGKRHRDTVPFAPAAAVKRRNQPAASFAACGRPDDAGNTKAATVMVNGEEGPALLAWLSCLFKPRTV